MNIIRTTFRQLAVVTLLSAGFGLNSLSLKAQLFTGQNTLTESPTSLRTMIMPALNSSILHVRFEHEGRGSVRIMIRDKKGKILYDESETKRKYAGQLDLGALTAGIYTLELTTSDARYREIIRIEPPMANRIIMYAEKAEDYFVVKQ